MHAVVPALTHTLDPTQCGRWMWVSASNQSAEGPIYWKSPLYSHIDLDETKCFRCYKLSSHSVSMSGKGSSLFVCISVTKMQLRRDFGL